MAENGRTYFDRQEVRDPDDRERSIFHALPGLIRHAIDNAPFYRRRLASVEPDAVSDREALACLPLTRKAELAAHQRADPPFGGLTATSIGRLAHLYASPGPIYDPEGSRADYWRFARAMYAAGFRRGDLVHNTFSYHLTPAGFMADFGARALGCPVIPGGTGQTELQVRTIDDLRPVAYVGTPSFLEILLEKVGELGLGRTPLTKALVSGEAFPRARQEKLAAGHGIDAYQCYATADLGLIAYESEAREGLVVDESLIVEIVEPDSGRPVTPGEIGEVVVTAFNPDYPLIRFATGDLSAVLSGESPCGRTNMRLRGWLGRADQSVKVRGMFVHPPQVQGLASRFPELARLRLIVETKAGRDALRLLCEVPRPADDLAGKIAEAARSVLALRTEVELVAAGSLPQDGKVIDDRR